MGYETLVVERRGPVGWLVFNRPRSGNAMDGAMFTELERAWTELDADDAVRVIVNTGNVIAASDATFLDPHVSVGQVSAFETIGLLRKMPAEAVMRMALVGRHERMPAQRAYELGMVSQVVDPPERLREEAQALGDKLARNSPAAMAATKRALWEAMEHGLTEACRLGGRELMAMWGHPDQEEGPLAFAGKRDPVWQPMGRS